MENQSSRAKRRVSSVVYKRSIKIGGRYSSVSLEDAFWNALKEIAAAQCISVYDLVSKIDSARELELRGNLSSALRLFVLKHYRELAETKRP
jgi:predicted DNA-binding ribbon-helix-helix protein